jgi:hypothetical protein
MDIFGETQDFNLELLVMRDKMGGREERPAPG